MIYFISVLLALAAVGLDQLTKYITVTHLAVGETAPFLPGLVHFTCLHNDGMSFSLLSGGRARWFFVIVTVAVIILAVIAVARRWINHPFGVLSLAAVLGGAVGNLIDRIVLGFVVDMIEVEFIRFAVFNVADIFVVCGGVAFMIYGVFFWKDPKEAAPHDSEG